MDLELEKETGTTVNGMEVMANETEITANETEVVGMETQATLHETAATTQETNSTDSEAAIVTANETSDTDNEAVATPEATTRVLEPENLEPETSVTDNEPNVRGAEILKWWEQQMFEGKDLFQIAENGVISVVPLKLMKARNVATISPENGDFVLKTLMEKFNDVVTRFKELEVEWHAAEDKLKVADKVATFKDFIQHVNAIGDYRIVTNALEQWYAVINELIAENIVQKTKLAELAESLVDSVLWKETTQVYKDINEKWKQVGYIDKFRNEQIWNRVEAAKQKFFDRKRLHHEDEEKDMFEALDMKIELAEMAEKLVDSEEWKKTSEKFQEILDKWKSLGRTLPKKNEELWQRITAAKKTFFDRKKVHFAQINKEQEANLVVKQDIVARAEALKESTDWGPTAQAYGALMEEWKKSGRVQPEIGEELWKRFIGANEYFFEAKRKHSEAFMLELNNNLNMKTMLIQRAEAIKNSSRWAEATVEMNKIYDEWKLIGPVPRGVSKKVWAQFIGARKYFFERKDNYRQQRVTYMETQKSARMQHAHELVHKMQQELALEVERLADLENALQNVTPGKKAAELTAHLEVLIGDSRAKMKRLNEKMEAGREEIEYLEEKEKKEREKKEKEMEAE